MVLALREPANSVASYRNLGIKDESTRAATYSTGSVPMHVPLFFTYAEKGPYTAELGYGDDLINVFGSEWLNNRGKFTTLATPFLNLGINQGGMMLVQRLKPEGSSAESYCVLGLEVLRTSKFNPYKLNGTKDVQISANNQILRESTEVEGAVLQWRYITINNSDECDITSAAITTNAASTLYTADPSATTSTIYPIIAFKSKWEGSAANNIGVRLYSADYSDTKPKVEADQLAKLYTFQVITREDSKSTGTVTVTNDGEKTVLASLKEGVFNRYSGNIDMSFTETFLDNYRKEATTSAAEKYGDLGEVYVYTENLNSLLGELAELELAAGNTVLAEAKETDLANGGTGDIRHLIDIMDPVYVDKSLGNKEVPYLAIGLNRSLEGAEVILDENTIHYLKGGDDGTLDGTAATNNAMYDKQVREQFDQFGELETKFFEMGRYPFKQVYDVGFSDATKRKMANVLKYLHCTNLTISTLDLVNSPNSIPSDSEQSAFADGFRTEIIAVPESKVYGTDCVRAVIIPGAGKIVGSADYKKYVPMTYDTFYKRSTYMNSPDGMLEGRGYDAPPYNHVTIVKDVTSLFTTFDQRESNWSKGITYFAYKTDKLVFCPMIKTVYQDDTSILNTDLNMQIACDIDYCCFQVWTELVGNSKLTDSEFIEASDRRLANIFMGRYDGRVVVVPNTQFDDTDAVNGYSWTSRIDLYGNLGRTVNKSFIVAHRMEDLENG